MPGNLIMSADERLERIAPGQARQEVMPLLRLADDSPLLVEAYCQCGELFALKGTDAVTRGVVLAVPALNGAIELKAVAVAPDWQGRGGGENGIPLRDMVWMDQEI
jgi:hypothetical protein